MNHTLKYQEFFFRIFLLTVLLLAVFGSNSFAQESKKGESVRIDSVFVPGGYAIIFKDTLIPYDVDTVIFIRSDVKYKIRKNPYQTSENFYANLDRFSDKKKVTRLIANAIFRMSDPNELFYEESVNSESIFESQRGKTISKIRVIQVPIVEGNVDDTLRQIETKTAAILDKVHIQTWESVIRNNLFFDEGDTVAPFLLADNERILRQFPFLKDARIVLIPLSDSSTQELEALIITQDVFSIGFGFGIGSLTDFDLSLYDVNFLGLGHEFSNVFKFKSNKDPRYGYFGSYKINNIRGSFVEFLLRYQYDFQKEELIGEFHKGFLTPSMKFGFGLAGGSTTSFLRFYDTAIDEEIPYSVRHELEDVWAGRQFQVSKTDERKNIILAGRVANFDYIERPELNEDTLSQFHDSRFVLGAITYKKVRYQKTAWIYRFGIPEDVPYGYVFELTGGFQRKEFYDRPYVGIRGAFVTPLGKSYVANSIQFGSFFNRGLAQEGRLSYKNFYISPLKRWGRYKFRIIGSLEYIYGINRLGRQGVSLDKRLRGFPSGSSIKGTHLQLARLELDLFTPWYFYGFRTVWFFFGEGALLGDDDNIFGEDFFYGAFGTGLRVRNESLVFTTFLFRIGFYTGVLPGSANFGYEFGTSIPDAFDQLRFGKPTFVEFR